MSPSLYSFRRHVFARERAFRLEPQALCWTDGFDEDRIAFDEIVEVRLHRRHMRGEGRLNKKIMWTCRLQRRSGKTLVLSPEHSISFRTWEDRSAEYVPFAEHLLAGLRAANPALPIIREPHWTMRAGRFAKRAAARVVGLPISWAIKSLRHVDLDHAADILGRLMRTVGPRLRGHRVARANLAAAFPEKSPTEIERILRGVWDNFGRACAEFAWLDRLWEDPPGAVKHVIVEPASMERIDRLRAAGRPVLWFGAHLANWELPATAAAALGFDSAMIFRRPEFGMAADAIIAVRRRAMGFVIAAGPDAPWQIRRALRSGKHVAMLVDRHSVGGIDVTFFGRRCKVNPMLARFARLFEYPIHGARAIRRPDGGLEFRVTDAIDPPRDANGKIDVAATMQLITAIVERWIREHPEQWMWQHRRWR